MKVTESYFSAKCTERPLCRDDPRNARSRTRYSSGLWEARHTVHW